MTTQIEAMKLALARLQARTDTADLDTIAALNEALAEQPAQQLIEDLLSALEYHTEQTRSIQFSKVAIAAAREYLRKPAQQNGPWCMKMNGCKTKCEDCPDEVAEQPAQPQPTIYVDPDAIRILLDPDHSGFVTARLTRHKPDPMRGSKVGLSITKGNT